jgi:carbon storage regulator
VLVLTRRVGEKLVIGNEIVVEVLSVNGDGVRLGIVAPRETSIHRFEVFDEIQTANRASSAFAVGKSGSSLAEMAAQVRKQKEPGEETVSTTSR